MQSNIENTISHIHNTLNEQINFFQNSRERNKKKAFLFKFTVVLLSAIAVIILGIEWGDEKFPVYTCLVINATIGVVSFSDGFFKNKELWILYTKTLNELLQAKSDLQYLESKGISNSEIGKLDELHLRIQNSLNDTNKSWEQLRSIDDQNNENN